MQGRVAAVVAAENRRAGLRRRQSAQIYLSALVSAVLVQRTNATHYLSAGNNSPQYPH